MKRKNGKSPIAVEIYLSIYKTNVTGISCRRFFLSFFNTLATEFVKKKTKSKLINNSTCVLKVSKPLK